MKRLLDEANALPIDEFRVFCDAVHRIKVLRVHAITEAFFADGGEVFAVHILARLAEQPLPQLLVLTGVCRLWEQLVHRVTVLNVPLRQHWRFVDYDWLLDYRFPRVHTLTISPELLEKACPAFGRITSLTVIESPFLGRYEVDDEDRSIAAWHALTSLSYLTHHARLFGIDTLTNLRSLTVFSSAFGDARVELPRLSALTALNLTDGEGTGIADVLCQLPSLTWLESDTPVNFRQYTGAGVLRRDENFELCEPGMEESFAYAATLQMDCNKMDLRGRWRDGVFTGWARLWWCNMGVSGKYRGGIVDNRREGEGEEWDYNADRIYRGGWRAGKRHGTGTVFAWTNDRHTLVPLLTGEWRDGQLLQ